MYLSKQEIKLIYLNCPIMDNKLLMAQFSKNKKYFTLRKCWKI